MSDLAIDGGTPTVTAPIARFKTIGQDEKTLAELALRGDLSGFLGGELRGGAWVTRLEREWAETFGVRHAIACNSATSGLLAAAVACNMRGDVFATSPYTMSATSAAPMWMGAMPEYYDVEDETFAVNPPGLFFDMPVVVTNLFGHPAMLHDIRLRCDDSSAWMIEDNSQSPFATENGRYAGTIGHIGVFSLNVHKHMQCGEGGVCVTNDDELAHSMRRFINHGEMAGGRAGLNLRMTEVSAAIALAQLRKGPKIVQRRIEIAEAIIDAIGDIPGLRPPIVRAGCEHVYYTIPFLIDGDRHAFVKALIAEGVPLVEGYVAPLYRLPAFAGYARPCPVAEDLHDRRLFYYENCGYDPTEGQIRQIGEAFQRVASAMWMMA